ncbi:MAG: type IV-A pilus assembly ATPase PilB [Candidatus Thiodiazotropha sp. (ex Lucina aurantia)]|uniref:Type IV-A pilus assembly ATPase PilB n=1 Tax=Candidatus Thiodiazotropha taylori TaxID=2792791 RepID=A0A9E4N8B6_9GAMM|nr:type IV-A pilus assembly ATPase PilB [Candidatus Thiodiazotropha sp. (ex Lucina pensylvanica)]MBT3022375.1 type IV-A pilus assembly ATPase PilB [Candidatus Thiodiazotropha taylori]MBT3054758.1 type IV-A pilus assembly ATPase PilB [Candidatus Thiodiazotropha sp. (ex Codakia orbicularis)]MBV2102028.1 type IV-A pilus assembly ATPase PilB [Candidatus Thiodiazotropha sp. (ex Lucina aurantia)]MBV2097598.1 type IV-A pilus assembly ATPase PilB [Candidatus Thiodiazotropha sp. (ex Codakia orbicularis)
MATTNPKVNLSGLARCLIQDGLISEEQAESAFAEALKKKVPFVSYLVENDILLSIDIAISASRGFGVPIFDLAVIDPGVIPTDAVGEKLVRTHHALPIFRRGNRLFLAVSDPTNHQGLDEIRFNTGLASEAILVEENKLTNAINKVMEAQETSMDDLLDADLDNLDISGGDDEIESDESKLDVDEAPVVRYINKLLLDAIKQGVSDIHFEPYEYTYRVRYRQDGILREVASPPSNLASRLSSRIKVMSRMNIAEKRVPQDGRIKMQLSKSRAIDFRVNTCPTLYGEKIVLRILDPTSAQLGIEALGFEEEQQKKFLDAINKPYGMILVTGPTGSGKTVSLYTALNLLNKSEVNISTAEDPVEIQVPGINQVNTNVKTGLTFAEALRAFLRQDPDIVMVGEIRDLETAEIAVKAAQTGHLVLSTLHTNDAPQTLTRLANMGVPPFNIASSVLLIMAQRLARRLCEHCKAPEDLPKEALLEEGFTEADIKTDFTIYKPVGCDMCTGGYKGRVGIFQVMPVSETMGKLIMEGGTSIQLEDQAEKEGVDNLRRSGLRKVMQGITSLQELNRVTKD